MLRFTLKSKPCNPLCSISGVEKAIKDSFHVNMLRGSLVKDLYWKIEPVEHKWVVHLARCRPSDLICFLQRDSVCAFFCPITLCRGC
jgi:hypothetical protein